MTKVIVVSSIRLYREGLTLALERDGRLEVLATTSEIEEIVGLVSNSVLDGLLLDIGTPGALSSMIETIREFDSVKVIAIGVGDQPDEIIKVAEAGIDGYVTQDGSLDDLVQAMQRACCGELFCSPTVAGALLRRVGKLAAAQDVTSDHIQITRRELEILQLINQGLSNKEIARQLCIQVATAKNHVHNLFEKLGVHRRNEAVAKLRHLGVLRLPSGC